ncbi:hypothetical protein HG536_0A03340 [Torulaspora globosa]|uniref:RIC1 C-terminal alpha solenoid region domain-containing protein n=1 Tax=Torulaspora globosa TaxID=48254 RepID=A0A7G3ZAI0_9SACH|nr:uncharacterized protein HG536_0A03340 [Torulaspora globosa]QLL30516.1 hypothetical protein HG536_0A03340 [Torulaspora globosa]
MSRHLWPLSPPQTCKINDSIHALANNEVNNNDILQTISLPQANVLVMVTPGRVLAYNMKPMALVASHERTPESIEEFGLNRSITQSVALDRHVGGLNNQTQSNSLAWNQGKIVFYVATDKSFLLTYQILKSSANITTFKDYGIPIIDFGKLSEDLEQEYDDSVDDDILTVFEKGKTSKIIQNGYAVTKEKGFLQFLSVNQENLDELPVRRLELRLKVVLKFDYRIIDIISFKRLSEKDEKAEESLLVLFPHGLQLLSLENFKLKNSSLVQLTNGSRICIIQDQLLVVAQPSDHKAVLINNIKINEQKVDVAEFPVEAKLTTCFELKGKMALVCGGTLVYYNPQTNELDYKFKVPFPVKICGKLNDETLILISRTNVMHFMTPFGNALFSSAGDSEFEEPSSSFEYSGFAYVDKLLVSVSSSGEYQMWDLWEEAKQGFSDARSPVSYVLQNNKNDIAIYSPAKGSSAAQDLMQVIKLPTRAINNCVPLIKISSNNKLMAVYVSNKNILLIQNLETNVWYTFKEMTVLDMHWLSSTYLLCAIKRDDWTTSVQCFRLNLQGLDSSDIAKYKIWEYQLQAPVERLRLQVSLFHKHKLLKIKSRENSELEKYGEKFYKTAEVIITTSDKIVIFAILSILHPSGIHIIKKFHEHAKITIPSPILTESIDWAASFKDGLIYCSDNRIMKASEISGSGWTTTVLLEEVERIIDILSDEIYVVSGHCKLFYKIDDLWEKRPPLLSIRLEDDYYPISVSPDATTIHGLSCVFHNDYSKLIIKHKIYLDQMISAKIAQNVSLQDISTEFRPIKHYNFALEKILSLKILASEPLDQIIELVKLCDSPQNWEASGFNPHSDMLEIISNCLRKIEAKHWNQLFSNLKMTPRELLARCLEGNEAKIIGVLLLVFLNYDVELVDDLRSDKVDDDSDSTVPSEGKDSAVADLIRDQEMMLKVLRLLVTSAANAEDSATAAESWDMCFQLIRLLKELDKQNKTQLVQQALQMFQ